MDYFPNRKNALVILGIIEIRDIFTRYFFDFSLYLFLFRVFGFAEFYIDNILIRPIFGMLFFKFYRPIFCSLLFFFDCLFLADLFFRSFSMAAAVSGFGVCGISC